MRSLRNGLTFNPEGVLSIHIPLERFRHNGIKLTGFQVSTPDCILGTGADRSNHFTGEVSGAIHGAIYALFLEKKSHSLVQMRLLCLVFQIFRLLQENHR